ncbi:MAG: hypothetical protein WCA07_08515 [Gloeobacterales cyanobacterium]
MSFAYRRQALKFWLQLLVVAGTLTISQAVHAQQQPIFKNRAQLDYKDSLGFFQPRVESVQNTTQIGLADPLGKITGCDGEILKDYSGFSISLYDTPNGTDLGSLVSFTPTEVPDNPNNSIPLGIAPNNQNSNPYFLSSTGQGTYNFFFDASKGQLDVGRTYILVINPPAGSIYVQRRVRLQITSRVGNAVSYRATALDGNPLATTSNPTDTISQTITIGDAATVGLVLITGWNTSICQPEEIQITKTANQVTAEPGDTIIYRVSLQSQSASALDLLKVTDTLPLGFSFIPSSVRASIAGTPVALSISQNGSQVTFDAVGISLAPTQSLDIVYATTLTPDALRGTGQNSAVVNGRRVSNSHRIQGGPAIYRVQIRPGILSDRGIILGLVFVDKNFDGEQQPGEPGVPNAVVYLEDGTRVTTDPNGLFSIANVTSGPHTGVLDLSSIPGYTLAPNLYFIELNSQSRLVNLEPGGMVRMNFGVTPVFGGVPIP